MFQQMQAMAQKQVNKTNALLIRFPFRYAAVLRKIPKKVLHHRTFNDSNRDNLLRRKAKLKKIASGILANYYPQLTLTEYNNCRTSSSLIFLGLFYGSLDILARKKNIVLVIRLIDCILDNKFYFFIHQHTCSTIYTYTHHFFFLCF